MHENREDREEKEQKYTQKESLRVKQRSELIYTNAARR